MSKISQRKGRVGELELARLLQVHGYPVEPGQAVSYGATPDLVGLPGVHIECKRVERLNVPEAMAQAERDAALPSEILISSCWQEPRCRETRHLPR